MVDVITQHIDVWTSALMNKSTAGRGTNGKQTAYGIKKLRELILELAVRGLLVPQDPNNEPASVLLEKIAEEKARLVKEGKHKRQMALPEIGEDEKPFTLPNGWEWVRLGDIAFSQAGFAFKSKLFNDSGEGLPLIRIRDVGQSFTGTYYSGEYKEEFVVNRGDYLISMDGQFRVASWLNDRALLNQRVSRLIFFVETIGKRFIADSLQARLLELQGMKAYTTVDHLSGNQISESIIALPPLAEQHRIVAKVDELMALCDRLEEQQTDSNAAHQTLVEMLLGTLTNPVHPELVEGCSNREQCPSTGSGQTDFETNSGRTAFEAAWQRIAEHFDTLFTTEHSIDQLKQTILQLAVMGKLVPQNPNDEPASVLLEKIAEEKTRLVKEGKLKKEKALPEISEEEISFELASGWEWCRFQNITKLITDGKHGDCNNLPNSGYYFLSAKDIQNGKLLYEHSRQIEPSEFQEVHNRTNLESGDICMVNTGATVGKMAIAPDHELTYRTTFQKSVAVIKITPPFINQHYIANFLVAETPKLLNKSGGSAINNLLLGDLKMKLVPLPPLAEQHRIVAKVDELMTLCDTLKARIKLAQTTQIHLADTIVEQAVA